MLQLHNNGVSMNSADYLKAAQLFDDKFQPGIAYPEEYYQEYTRAALRVGIPAINSFLKIGTIEPDGTEIIHYDDRSHTLNRNYWSLSFRSAVPYWSPAGQTQFANGFHTFKNANGTIYTGQLGWNTGTLISLDYNYNGTGIGQPDGIRVGTATDAESFEGYTMQGFVGHGNSAGQLYFQAQTTTNGGTQNGYTWTTAISRYFNNNSGGTIGINEVCMLTGTYGNVYGQIMWCRDKLGATVNVLNAGTLTVNYSFSVTMPNV